MIVAATGRIGSVFERFPELRKGITLSKAMAIHLHNAHRLCSCFKQWRGSKGAGCWFEKRWLSPLRLMGSAGASYLLDQLCKGEVLVVWKFDLFSRSLCDVLTNMELLSEAKARSRSLTEAIDTTTLPGRMIIKIFGTFAEFESAMLREGSKAGRVPLVEKDSLAAGDLS